MSLYVVLLVACSITSFTLIYFAWRSRHLANPLPFSAVMFAAAQWSVAYALVINSTTMDAKILWVKIGYIGASIIPVAWLTFVLQYSRRQKIITRRNIILFSLIPFMTILFVWTNEVQHLIWKSAKLDSTGQFLIFEYGLWLWVIVVYSYGLLLWGTIVLIQTLNKLSSPDTGQIASILFGAFSPWVGNFMFISGLNPLKPLDPTPFTFLLAGVALYWGFYRFRLLSGLPLVQSTLFANLPDGVLVLNAQNTVVTLNPAAKQLVGSKGVGRPLTDFFPAAAAPLEKLQHETSAQTIFSTGDGTDKRFYDWRLSTLYSDDGLVNGRIITLRDITKEQQDKEKLQALHQKTEAQTETLRQRENYLQILNDITQAAVNAQDLAELLQAVADKMGMFIGADACHISLWDEAEQRTIPGAASGFYKNTYHAIRIDPGEITMTQSVLNLGHALPIENTFNTPYISQRLANSFPGVKSVLALPFITANERLGAALLLFNQPHQFTTDEINNAEQAATQIALAIAKIKLNDAMKRQIEELAILNDIATAGAESNNVDELISRAIKIIGTKFYADNYGIYLLDEHNRMLRARHSYHRKVYDDSQLSIPLGRGIVGKVAATGQPLRIGDVSQSPDYLEIVPEIRSELCVPLRADDKILGVIDTESVEFHNYTLQDEQFLATIAGQLATAIKKIQLLSSEQSRRQEAETLRKATAVLTSTLDLNHLLDLILQQLETVIAYDSATIFMFQDTKARIMASRGLPDNEKAAGKLFPAHNSLLTAIKQNKQPIFLEDAQQEPAYEGWVNTGYTKGWLGVPLIVRDEVIGYLTIDSHKKSNYGQNEAESALAFANQAAIAIENARLYRGEIEQRQVAETLRNANIALTQKLDFHAVLETLLDYLKQLIPYDSAAVMQLKPNGQIVMTAQQGYENRPDFQKISSYSLHYDTIWSFQTILQTRKGLLISDTQKHPNWQQLSDQEYDKSWIGMPLIVGNNVFGFFSVNKADAGFFTENHLRLTELLAGQTAVAIQNAILFEDAQQRAEEMETINNVTTAFRPVKTVDDVLAAVLEMAINVINGIRGQVALADPEINEFVCRASYPHDPYLIGQHFHINSGIMGHIISSSSIYTTQDLFSDPLARFTHNEISFLEPVKGSVFLPLHAQNRIIGILHLGIVEKRPFDNNEIQLLTTIAEIAGNALDRALLLETLEQRIIQRTNDLSMANIRLQELDRLKTKFISDVSHELRTPITNINLYLDLFEQGNPDRQPYYMEVLRKETGRLTKLIEDTLSLSRLDTSRAKIEMQPTDLNQIIQPIVAAHQLLAESAQLTLITNLASDLPLIPGEPNQISQVVTHLITNAINYTSAGKIELNTMETADKTAVCLEVIDTGMGIDLEDRKHIFGRFYRGKNTGQFNIPGTGLGLSIVKEIVDLHEGRIEVESELDQGSTFRIYFPCFSA